MAWEALESEVTEPVRYSTAELYLRREGEKTKSERLPELIRKASSMGLLRPFNSGPLSLLPPSVGLVLRGPYSGHTVTL